MFPISAIHRLWPPLVHPCVNNSIRPRRRSLHRREEKSVDESGGLVADFDFDDENQPQSQSWSLSLRYLLFPQRRRSDGMCHNNPWFSVGLSFAGSGTGREKQLQHSRRHNGDFSRLGFLRDPEALYRILGYGIITVTIMSAVSEQNRITNYWISHVVVTIALPRIDVLPRGLIGEIPLMAILIAR
jgi:hypothetical protein